MARNPDDYFADLTSGGAAVEAKPRYEPAPKTPEAADARLAEVDAAEEEIRAWDESKRAKKGGARPAPAEPAAPAAKPAEKKSRPADEYFADLMPPPAPPKAPEKPGMIDRAMRALGEGRSKPDPTLSGITPEQARGITGDVDAGGLSAVASKPAGLLSGPSQDPNADPMLRPEFIERVRNRFANVPAHMRLPALREYAKTNDASGRAARQILREVESQNGRITGDDERLAKRIGPLTEGPERGGQKKPDPLQFPDPTPSFGDTMDGVGTEEVAQRRLTAQKVAEAGRPSMREAKAGVAQQRVEKESPAEGTWLETPWNLYSAGASGIGRMVAAGAGLVDAMSSEGSLRQELAAGLQEWASGTADELGAQQSRKLKQEGIEFARLINDKDSSVADMAGYLVTRPELFASKFAESVIPMILTGVVGRIAGAGAAAKSTIALGGASRVTPAAAERIGQIAGNAGVAGAVVTEAAQIAGGVFSKAIEDGMSRDAAQRSAGNAFLGALAIGRVTGGGASGAVAAGRAGAVREGAKEFGEEYAQTWLETLAPALGGGQEIDVAKANKEAVAGGLIGAGVGGATGGMNSLQAYLTPKADKPLPPTQMRSEALRRFDELAAQFGMNPKSVAAAKQAASEMPAVEVPGFLGRMTEALQKRGMVSRPIDEQGLAGLSEALDGKPEAPPDDAKNAAVSRIESVLKDAGALPGDMPDATGLLDEATAQPAPVEGEKINRNWSSFSPDSGTLNIPRSQMPQIAAEHRGALVNFLNARGVSHEMATVDPGELKPTQGEFEPKKVAAIAEKPSGRSLLVSADGHILDGHHQWLAARERSEPVRVVRLDADIQDLLRLAHQFPSSTTATGPRKAANDQPVVPSPAGMAAGAADAGSPAGARSGGDQRPAAAVDGQLDGAAAAPVPGSGTAGAVGDGGGPDAALSEERTLVAQPGLKVTFGGKTYAVESINDAQQKWEEFRDRSGAGVSKVGNGVRITDADGKFVARISYNGRAWGTEDDGTGRAEKPLAEAPSGKNAAAPVSAQAPVQAGATEAAAPQKSAAAPATSAAARPLGSYGRTPNGATPVELRPNADGTLTPWTGKYPMVDYESGDPISIPADASDAEAVDAIRAAKAIVPKDKFFGIKPSPSAAPAAETATPSTDAEPAESGAAPTEATRDERIAAARTRIDGLKALLACLGKA